MKYGIPIRLSSNLATHAREVAGISDRSLTEQVEHWARLGQVVEANVTSTTVSKLKALSYDEKLPSLIAAADTPGARASTVAAVRERAKGPLYGVATDDPNVIVRHDPDGTITRGRFVDGAFAPLSQSAAKQRARLKKKK